MNAVTLMPGPLAPGELILIKGSGLADTLAVATVTPLLQQLAGASVYMGGAFANLLYANSNQLIGQVPFSVPVNTSQQILLQRDNSLGVPSATIVAAAQPAVFTADGSGTGQALIYQANAAGVAVNLANSTNPVQPGGTVIIYCAGLGAVDSQGNVTNPVTVSIGGQPAQVTYAGVALPASYPAGGAPMILGLVSSGLGGLYQITATVPTGVATGPAAVIVNSAEQTSQLGVTLMVAGTGSVAPSITPEGIVNAASYAAVPVAPGSLVAIFTSALSAQPASFTTATLPPSLGGVGVTFNGITAPMVGVSPSGAYPFVSAQVPFEVLSAGQTSATSARRGHGEWRPNRRPCPRRLWRALPGIFTIPPTGQGNAVLVNLADSSIAAPSGSIPGLTAHPIPRGQTAYFYVTGLGSMTPSVADGSGTCPAANGLCSASAQPTVSVGGVPAPISFAGQAAGFPGVMQINITVPQNAPTGSSIPLIVKSANGTVISNSATIAVQ